MGEASKIAFEEVRLALKRPYEIATLEARASAEQIRISSIETARTESDPLKQRLAVLSGEIHADLNTLVSDVVTASVVGIYHAVNGILYVPFVAGWRAFWIGSGIAGTVLYNVLEPVKNSAVFLGQLTGSATAAAGVATLGAIVGPIHLPGAPVVAAGGAGGSLDKYGDQSAVGLGDVH